MLCRGGGGGRRGGNGFYVTVATVCSSRSLHYLLLCELL